MHLMPDFRQSSASDRSVRDVADAYVGQLAVLDPLLATSLGLAAGQDRLPDLSPAGDEAMQELATETLARLAEAEDAGFANDAERRCARLLRERLEAGPAV